MRVRDLAHGFPKCILPIGGRPILWNIMKYYASFGHNEFIICLGYRAKAIEDYFHHSPDIEPRYPRRKLRGLDIKTFYDRREKWSVTCVYTGLFTSIGQRLKCVEPLLEGEELFLANYGDNLTDAPMEEIIEKFKSQSGRLACFLAVRPNLSFHMVSSLDDRALSTITSISPIAISDVRVNGGYFVFRRGIFDALCNGRDLVDGAFVDLIKDYKLMSWSHDGFWIPLDTAKDYFRINNLFSQGRAPWVIWDNPAVSSPPLSAAHVELPL